MTFLGTMRSNRRGLSRTMIQTAGREEKSTIVWHEKEQGRITLSSYAVRTKSKGMKCVLLLSNFPDMATLGVTKDDGHLKTSLFKLYDFTKGGTDITGISSITYLFYYFIPKSF